MQSSPTLTIPALPLVAPASSNPVDRDAPTAPMHLTSRPRSVGAIQSIESLAAIIIELKGRQTKGSGEYHHALGAMVADLLRAAAHEPPLGCFRSMRAGDFTGGPVGYQPFKRALGDMERHGYVTLKEGKPWWDSESRRGTVTRVHITPKLTDYLATYGITAANPYRHFVYEMASETVPPIQLRASSAKCGPDRIQGRRMKVDYTHSKVAAYADQIRRINAFIGQHTVLDKVGNKLDIALYRSFNMGNIAGHNYAKGGRVYAAYQNIKREDRDGITFDGQATVEVDISACFLTLAHFLLDRPFCNVDDPYAGPAPERSIVKSWVNLSIGYSGFHSRWPTETIKKFAERGIADVPKRYPIRLLKDDILPHLPIIKEWVDSEYTWADLFMLESEIMIDAVDRLARDHRCLALPVHDALRVSTSKAQLARTLIRESFIKHTGINPIIK